MADKKDEPLLPKNVYIVGAHCTGKSTLIEALAKHFTPALVAEIFGPNTNGPQVINEVVRMVMEMQGFNANHVRDPVRGFTLQMHTLWAQYQLESVFNEFWLFSDRSGLDPIVYAHVFLGSEESSRLLELPQWAYLRERMREGLVVVCEPNNVSWLSSDAARVSLEGLMEWRAIADTFREILHDQGIKFVTIPADLEDLELRVQFVEGLVRSGF